MKTLVKKFFWWSEKPLDSISLAALVIAISGIGSRLLGLLRDRLLASQFGAGDTLDAYYAAFRIPDFLYSLLILGALSSAFIPVFTDLIESDRKAMAWKLASTAMQWFMIVLGGVSVIVFFCSHPITAFLAPGFHGTKLAETELLMRIMLLSPIFLLLSAVVGGVLVSFRKFIAYSLAPIFYNVGIIIGITCLVPTLGIAGLAWGVVLGALLHLLIQCPALYRSGFQYSFSLRELWVNQAMRRVFFLMIPRSLAMGVNQASLLIVTLFASTLASGSIAVLALANNIQSVPLGLFGVSFALAAFPALAASLAKGNERAFLQTLARTTRRILFFVVPCSLLFIIFRAQFVRVILGSGHFNWQDTILTFETMKFLAVSLFAQSLVPLFARAFFALQDTRTPLLIALVSEMIHIALLPFLIPIYGVEGMAMAFSAGTIANGLLLYLFLRRRFASWRDSDFFTPALKIALASLVAMVAAQLSKYVFGFVNPTEHDLDTFVEVFTQLSIGIGTGGVVFVLVANWLRVEELEEIRKFIWCKVLRQEPGSIATAESSVEHGGNEA
ncbi:MAG: murein biosynthesis integral membrane protein MurJ [Candidatus Moraniibacteriota bacterium]